MNSNSPGAVVPAPDLKPLKPNFDIPDGACDCHVHIFGPPGAYPFKANPRYLPAEAYLDAFVNLQRTLGFTRAVIVHPTIYQDHQITIDALAASGGHWRGIARVSGDVTAQELHTLREAGFRGARFDTRTSKDGPAELKAAAPRLADAGWHAQLHLKEGDTAELEPFLKELGIPVVLDHFGRIPPNESVDGPSFKALLRLLATGRVWVKLSAPYRFGDADLPYPTVTPFARALVTEAPDRLLWGSDWPHTSYFGPMPNDGPLLDLLAEWAPNEQDRQKILRDNPAILYDFAR